MGIKQSQGDLRGTGFPGSWEAGAGNVGGIPLDAVTLPSMSEVNRYLKSSTGSAGGTFSGVFTEIPPKADKCKDGTFFSPLKTIHPVRKLRSQNHVVSAPEQEASQFLYPWLNEKDNG